MALGNKIIVTSLYGRRVEGVISGTPLPGTIMQVKAATALVHGRPTWEPYNRAADGDRPQGPLIVLDMDTFQGRGPDDAYVDGDRGFGWVLAEGDEVNVRWSAAGTGTGDAVAIGDIGIVDDGTGLIVATTGTPETESFMAMEAVSDVVLAGTLVHSIYSGH